MAKLTVTPPPKPVERTFTLVLTKEEAMHVWADLGPSTARQRWTWAEKELRQELVHNVDVVNDLYKLLDDAFRKQST